MDSLTTTRPIDVLGSAPAVSLAVLLERVKSELDALTEIVGDMQTGLSPILIDVTSNNAEKCRHAQSLDLVWQTLESLSRVLHAAALEGAAQHNIDIDAIAEPLPLADLAARLRGREKPPQPFGNDLDLF